VIKKKAWILPSVIAGALLIIINSNYLTLPQKLSLIIFITTVFATLVFWRFHLPIAFLGVGALLLTRTLDIQHLITFASLDLIVFLIGMMVLVGLLREAEFFTWLLEKILLIRNLNAIKLFLLIIGFSFLLTSLVGQVASVIFMSSLVLEICNFFAINPLPFIMVTLMTTNIASAGTILGSPAGILLETYAGLHFKDFLFWSFPITLSCLLVGTGFLWMWYRGDMKKIETKIKEVEIEDRTFRQLINVPATREIKEELFLLGTILFSLTLHFQIEKLFSLPPNTLLVAIPLVGAGIALSWKKEEARVYIEEHVDWWTIVFFILFFAKAGTFKYTGVTNLISSFLENQAKIQPLLLITEITWISSLSSSIMDNVVVVSILVPAIKALEAKGVAHILTYPLWWGLFLGGCFGSNITMIGSPANIVALGLLEKQAGIKIGFFQWVKVGLILALITTTLASIYLIVVTRFLFSLKHLYM